MAKQKKVPMLRFPEFRGEWISEIFDNTTSITRLAGYEYSAYWKEDESMEIIALRGYNIGKGRLVLRDLGYISNALSLQLGRSKLFRGDIVYPCVGSIGNACVIEEDNKYHIQQNIAKITCKEGYSPYFFAQFLMSHLGKGEVDRFNATSSQPNVLVGSLRNFRISLPSLPEQQKIASFLTAVDDKIQHLSKKKALLEKYKKGVMQQLFSQQLRFKDDQGNVFPDWERKKLGDVAIITMGQSPDSASYNSYGDGIPLIQGNADMKERMSLPRNWTTAPTKVCKPGDLILTVRAPVGSIGKSIHDACLGRGVCSIRNNAFSSVEFLYQFLLEYEPKWSRLEQGSTFTAVSGADIRSIELFVPSIEEQSKIASFLTAIDDKINGVTQQIEQTKQFKKGLLQQMFV